MTTRTRRREPAWRLQPQRTREAISVSRARVLPLRPLPVGVRRAPTIIAGILTGQVGLVTSKAQPDERRAVPADVRLPTVLRAQADGQASVAADGATIGEVFNTLIAKYPGLQANLLDESGGLHKFVNVYKNDDDIRYLEGLDTKVDEGDVVSILPAVAGG